jgi:AGCS family alanine or glycine:cation symporter
MSGVNWIVASINETIWADWTLYVLLGAALIHALERFSQWRALTRGITLLRRSGGDAPSTMHAFQALCLALAGTAGVGSTSACGDRRDARRTRAVFWMWVVAVVAMGLKFTKSRCRCCIATRGPSVLAADRCGSPAWVSMNGRPAGSLGRFLAAVFCVALLVVTFTGSASSGLGRRGLAQSYFGVAPLVTATALTILVAAVLFGGARRLGAVIGCVVPIAFVLYALCGLGVLITQADGCRRLRHDLRSAFSAHETGGAFLGHLAATRFCSARAFYSTRARARRRSRTALRAR